MKSCKVNIIAPFYVALNYKAVSKIMQWISKLFLNRMHEMSKMYF